MGNAEVMIPRHDVVLDPDGFEEGQRYNLTRHMPGYDIVFHKVICEYRRFPAVSGLWAVFDVTRALATIVPRERQTQCNQIRT